MSRTVLVLGFALVVVNLLAGGGYKTLRDIFKP